MSWIVTTPVFQVAGFDQYGIIGDTDLVEDIIGTTIVELPTYASTIEYDRDDRTAVYYAALMAAKRLGVEVIVTGDPPPEPDNTIGVPVDAKF